MGYGYPCLLLLSCGCCSAAGAAQLRVQLALVNSLVNSLILIIDTCLNMLTGNIIAHVFIYHRTRVSFSAQYYKTFCTIKALLTIKILYYV